MVHERIALGMPSLASYEIFSALEKAKELGFQSIMSLPGGPNTRHSLGEFPTLNFYEGSTQHREMVKNMLSGLKHISIHQAWDSNWETWIDCADYFGAKIVTVHPPAGGPQSRQELIAYFRRIGDYALHKGIRVGIENVGGKYDEYVCLIGSMNHPAIGATIDVGHCAYFTAVRAVENIDERIEVLNEILRRLVNDMGEKLYHFHLHNVRKTDWRDHRSVTNGIIDFPSLFAATRKIGYSGIFDIELEEPEMEKESSKSGEYLSQLIERILNDARGKGLPKDSEK